MTTLAGRPADPSCAGFRHAMQVMSDNDTLDNEWDDGAATLVRSTRILD